MAIVSRLTAGVRSRRDSWPTLSPTDYIDMMSQFTYNGVQYTLPGDKQESIDGGMFREVVRSAFKQNGIVFACMLVRMMTFSEARLCYRQMDNGRAGNLFGDPNLRMFERPWPGANTSDLLKRLIQYADLGGTAYAVRRSNGVRLLRPDWTEAIIGSMDDAEVLAWDVDAEVLGYRYTPGGRGSRRPPQFFLANEVATFSPIPDPEAQFRGMSWITPVVREIMADKSASDHKLKFFENGATPNLVVKLNVDDLTKFKAWIKEFREDYEGQMNAYKTMFLGAGADPTVVGANLRQLDFKVVQGAGETRIAAAANVPPIIVGLSEGLQAATYSNYGQARRRFADMTMRPLWRDAARSLECIADLPNTDGSVQLWYDDRDIPALKEDLTDAAEVTNFKASAALSLYNAGYDPDSITKAVETGDFTLLSHSGLPSVQTRPDPNGAKANGKVPAALTGKEG